MPAHVRRALISVSDKSGIVKFCRDLEQMDIALLSTGGTFRLLRSNNIQVTDVSDYTGFPEIMDGRVKTLHPKIHGGLLGRPGLDDAIMEELDIPPIDLVVVNLYPFEATVKRADCTLGDAIENIDIGGPTMLRAAAKNYEHTGVIVDAADYPAVLKELRENGARLSVETCFRLAQKVFSHTANYDANVANYLGASDHEGNNRNYPHTYTMQFALAEELRYGENPHQSSAFYTEPEPAAGTLAAARQLQGKALSYNNLADADAALECVSGFDGPACVIVKHANPCGVAAAGSLKDAYAAAYETDPVSAFGGIIAFNRSLDRETAQNIIEQQFVEVILAPDLEEGVLAITEAKPGVRVLVTGEQASRPAQLELKRVSGGLLVQDSDTGTVRPDQLNVVSRRKPGTGELKDMLFAWQVVKYVKSNAIVYARDKRTVGIGAGQMSRVYSARIAAIKAADAGLEVAGAVMASDAFFPFRDGIDSAAESGIRAVIQPGGSVRDSEVIAAADEHGMAMVFTSMRHFRH